MFGWLCLPPHRSHIFSNKGSSNFSSYLKSPVISYSTRKPLRNMRFLPIKHIFKLMSHFHMLLNYSWRGCKDFSKYYRCWFSKQSRMRFIVITVVIWSCLKAAILFSISKSRVLSSSKKYSLSGVTSGLHSYAFILIFVVIELIDNPPPYFFSYTPTTMKSLIDLISVLILESSCFSHNSSLYYICILNFYLTYSSSSPRIVAMRITN